MKHWYTMIEIPDADTRSKKGEKVDSSRPLSEKIMLATILIIVGVVAFAVASCFAKSLDRHVFCAEVTFGESGVVVSTETIKGEQ